MRVDPDRRPFSPPPDEYYSPFGWDAADQTLFRPISRFFAVDPGGEATNVNSMDEVPSSSWFTDRMGARAMDADAVAQGACTEPPLDPSGPWTIASAKPGGANPGFVIDDARGRRYLLKFDSAKQPERATSADVIGALLYWATGYNVPCNTIAFFRRDILRIAPDATVETETGDERPLRADDLDLVFAKSHRRADGRWRAMASRYLDGDPLGPWQYQGTREDDYNDVVPHQDRRELRGAYVFASWINHFDSREQNTLATWIATGDDGRGYVRHNFVDFGDSLGSMWAWDAISRRLGHAYYLDFGYLVQDLVTLGVIERPWHRAELGPAGPVLGYFDVERFEPDAWRPGYPNPAFSRMTERDAAWAARIVARFRDRHVRAMVEQARIEQDVVHGELLRILIGRRDRILRRWFRRLSPLTGPEVSVWGDRARLCLRDLAVHAELIDWERRPYWTRAWVHRLGAGGLEPIDAGPMVRRRPDRICVGLPSVPGARPDAPVYLIVDVTGLVGPNDAESAPARVHLYQIGPRRYAVVGLERPYDDSAPGD